MNTKASRTPPQFFLDWCTRKGVPKRLIEYNNYTNEGVGYVFEDYDTNLYHSVYVRAINNPDLKEFEQEVEPLEFTFQKLTTGLYTNSMTIRAWDLWQTVCGKHETEQDINKLSEVNNDR